MKQYIIDKNAPNIGSCESILRPDGSVMYTEFKSFEEYQAAHPEKDLMLISEEGMMQRYEQHMQDLQEDWQEETEEDFNYALECVPFIRWSKISDTIDKFFCGEPYSGLLHRCHVYDSLSNKYYSALRSVAATDEELLLDFVKITHV